MGVLDYKARDVAPLEHNKAEEELVRLKDKLGKVTTYKLSGGCLMQIKHLILLITSMFLTTACYGTLSGRVIDAETSKPIEGAIVLGQWTITKGVIGLTSSQPYKVVETETDKEGHFAIDGPLNPFVNAPEIVVYKDGYVAWRNDFIFPSYEKRTNFQYGRDVTIKLEKFKEGYFRGNHHIFMTRGISSGGPKFNEAERQEDIKTLKELKK